MRFAAKAQPDAHLLLLALSVPSPMMVSTCLLAAALLPVVFGAVLVVGPSLPMDPFKCKIMLRQSRLPCWICRHVPDLLLIDKTFYGGDGFI